jgi:hypothetical protein
MVSNLPDFISDVEFFPSCDNYTEWYNATWHWRQHVKRRMANAFLDPLLTVILTRTRTISRARIANFCIYFLFKILSFIFLDILRYTYEYAENSCNSCHNVDITLHLHALWVILRLQFWRTQPIAGDCWFSTVGRPHVRTRSTPQLPYPLLGTDTFLVSRLHCKLTFTLMQKVCIIGLFFCFMLRCYYKCAGGTERAIKLWPVLAVHNNIFVIGQTSKTWLFKT